MEATEDIIALLNVNIIIIIIRTDNAIAIVIS